ncbi:unnamed protein product [Knipowitschia caucasica]
MKKGRSQKRSEQSEPRSAQDTGLDAEEPEKMSDNAGEISEILKELRQFRNETSGNFADLKKEVTDLKQNFDHLKIRMDEAEQRIAHSEDKSIELTKVLFHMMRKQKQIEEKCEDLESRSRRKNLRIYAVPEKEEGENMVEFIKKLIREQLNIQEEIFIERAHRAAVISSRCTDYARSIIVRFRSYVEKQRVLHAAWGQREVCIKDRRIYFDGDFAAGVFKERALYRSARKQLQERRIKSRILFPAKLKLFLQDGKTKTFESPREAAEGLREFGVTMELPKKELDWEKALCAVGWESQRSRGKHAPAGEITTSVEMLRRSLDVHEEIKMNDE